VLAIYIRDVSTSRRARTVRALATEVESAGVPMQLVEDTEAAAEHAVAKGFIPESALPHVHRAKASDEQA
jgi:phosphatidate phosphatase APP1